MSNSKPRRKAKPKKPAARRSRTPAPTIPAVGETAAPMRSPFADARAGLFEATEALNGALDALATRLMPVLSPGGPREPSKTVAESGVELLDTLFLASGTTAEATERVQSLMQRLVI